jgi:hypothetical protein
MAQQHGGVRFCRAPPRQPERNSTAACASAGRCSGQVIHRSILSEGDAFLHGGGFSLAPGSAGVLSSRLPVFVAPVSVRDCGRVLPRELEPFNGPSIPRRRREFRKPGSKWRGRWRATFSLTVALCAFIPRVVLDAIFAPLRLGEKGFAARGARLLLAALGLEWLCAWTEFHHPI